MTPETTHRQDIKDGSATSGGCLLNFQKPSPQENPTGILSGAKIVTRRGAKEIQNLRPGDQIVTRANGIVPLLRIQQQSCVARAIYVIAGSLGHHQPNRDTMLPAGQSVLIRDWRAQALAGKREIIAPAEALVDGEFVRDIGWQLMTVYRLVCARSEVIYADGMELLSAENAFRISPAD